MLRKIIFKIGKKLRNPSLNGWSVFLKKTESWSLEELESYQLLKLKELIEIAYNNSNFYKNLFDKNELIPLDIKTLDDITKLPIVLKEDLIKHNKEIQILLKNNKFFKANTSGTTGQPLSFLKDESADSFNRASMFRGYSWFKVNAWSRNGYFWGYNFSFYLILKTKVLDFLQNRFRVFSFKEKELDIFSNKLKKATYLHGYSSAIYKLAKHINKNVGSRNINLKMIKGTSEKIVESYQSEVKKAFGLKMISEYGAAETGIIAFECTKGNMHINMEGVVVEEIDNEIIVTNLQMKSFPIIRYRLGDYIKLASKEKKCDCGMQHLILEEVTGRVGDIVYGLKLEYPSLYFYYIFKKLTDIGLFLTYQVIQNEKGKLIVLIEQDLTKNNKNLIKTEFEAYFKNDMELVINDNNIIKIKGTKLKSFISNIK